MPARGIRTLFPPLFFLAWAILFSFPVVLHLGNAVALSRGGDAWLHIWDLWWLDKSLLGLGQNPYYTNYILYPTGLNLYYHSLDLFNGLLSIPLQHLFGLTATFNLLTLANLTMDGLAAYWLCLDRTQSVGASLVGGALFAAAPLLGTSLDLGQLDEMTVWWVPLYMLALWRALDSPGPVWKAGGGRGAALAAGVCLVGASLATWYFAAGLAIFTIFFVPAYLWNERRKRNAAENRRAWGWSALKVGAIVALFVVVLSPLLLAMVRERLSGATYMLPTLFTTKFNSADLVGLFLPPRLDSDINRHESSVALGYVALLLSLAGLVAMWRKLWPVGLALLALVVMAMGPELQVAGNQTGIPLPYALLNNVPFVGASRQPLRFLAAADACLSLLAAFGVSWLLGLDRLKAWKSAVVPVTLALVALELFGVPRVMINTAVGPAYTFLKDNPTHGAVVEVPADNWSALSLLDQTVHGRSIVGGYTSRHFPYPFADAAPGIAQLVGSDADPLLAEDILDPPASKTALASLDHYNVRFVVVHKPDLATGRYGRLERVLGFLFTSKDRVYDDAEVTIYKAPTQPDGLASNLPLVGLGSGWHNLEQNPLHRWTGSNVTDGNALVWVGIPTGAVGHYTLKLTAYAYKSPRTLSIQLDNNTLLTRQLGTAFEDVTVDLGQLGAGDHIVLLKVKEPPESPPGDVRKLGIGVTHIAVERTAP